MLILKLFPAVISTKLEAAIERDEERKREKRIMAERGARPGGAEKKGKLASEFELLLNDYSKIEADEIAVCSIRVNVLCSVRVLSVFARGAKLAGAVRSVCPRVFQLIRSRRVYA